MDCDPRDVGEFVPPLVRLACFLFESIIEFHPGHDAVSPEEIFMLVRMIFKKRNIYMRHPHPLIYRGRIFR